MWLVQNVPLPAPVEPGVIQNHGSKYANTFVELPEYSMEWIFILLTFPGARLYVPEPELIMLGIAAVQ